jgi:ATP-binding cassette subfamily C (CFTR/MRP) protein 4
MQKDNENQALLSDKKTYYDTDDEHRLQSSRLEWAESSWTRLLHVLCYSWLNPIFYLGYKRQLTENDLGDAPHIDKSLVLLERLHSYDWSSTTTWTIVWKEFWKEYIFANRSYVLFIIASIAQPLIVRQFILNMMDKQGSTTVGYLYVVTLFISVVMQIVAQRQAFFGSIRVGVRMRNALIMIIYDRSLFLKPIAWEKINTGQILNLIANDTLKFEEICTYLIALCSTLFPSIIIFGLLCWIIHPIPTLCCYALLSLFILLQLHITRKFGQCREITTMCSDQRIQAFSEFTYEYHTVKMYNWEKSMEDHIIKMREKELANIRYTSRFRAFNAIQYFISAPLLAFVTFGSAWLLDYPLNAANTFTVLLLFAFIRDNVMYYLLYSSEKLAEARFASKRIDSFMSLPMKKKHQSSLSTSSINRQQKGSIIMSNASFSWNNEIPCLSSLDLTIKQGTFVGIVGPVGSGKSSLLAAILDEMNLISGQLNTNDSSFSYIAQSPWIFSDTFRNNILLNQPFDEQIYRNVIQACCLDVDLSILGSSGDLIVIGEKGVSLSGGQKARVALARALYVDADIYLLDDPLSAVDRTVAKQIYERCIGPHGLLKNRTRVLVTHQTQFLNESHQTIILSHGHIAEQTDLNENIVQEDVTNNKNETSVLADILDANKSMPDAQSIISDETPSNDDTKWSVWYLFFTAPPSGTFGFCLLIILFLLGEVLYDGMNYWLSIWLTQSQADQRLSSKFAYIYFGLIIATVFADIICKNYYFTVVLNGSNSLHNNMLKGLLYTSIQFFESNPSGRILNRASKDQHVLTRYYL